MSKSQVKLAVTWRKYS